MTLLTKHPEVSSSTIEATLNFAARATATESGVRGGSYVSLPAGSHRTGVEGSYVTVAGAPNLPPVTRGSYITVDGGPVVAAGTIEGSYVTLPAGA